MLIAQVRLTFLTSSKFHQDLLPYLTTRKTEDENERTPQDRHVITRHQLALLCPAAPESSEIASPSKSSPVDSLCLESPATDQVVFLRVSIIAFGLCSPQKELFLRKPHCYNLLSAITRS